KTGEAPKPDDGEDAAPVSRRWTFTDKDGNLQSVEATGLNDARKKLPKDFTPDLTKAPTQEEVNTPETLKGEKINKEWTAFAPESGTLGFPRDDMPQVKAEHRGALTNFLKGKGIESDNTEALPSELKPTQAEYSQGKVDKAREFTGGDRAILVS